MNDDILEQAADWADRFAELDATERLQLEQWLTESTAHQHAFDKMCTLLGMPELTTALVIKEAETHNTEESVAEPHNSDKNTVVHLSAWRMLRPSFATAATIMVTIVAAIALKHALAPTPEQVNEVVWQQDFSTRTGQRDHVQLNDGSVVAINAESSFSAKFATYCREITLHKGQAYFDVSRDSERPFVIHAGDTTVTVLGTAFDVNRLDNDIIVSVTEGKVTVAANKQVILEAGQRVRIADGKMQLLKHISHAADDWTEGWYEASNQPLTDVLEQLDRYLEKPLTISLDLAAQQRISGRFRLDDAENTLQLIASLYDLKVEDAAQTISVSEFSP